MCGIVGYNGFRQAQPILLEGLARLEYRGYDSAGMAVRDGSAPTGVVKAQGRLSALAVRLSEGRALVGDCGIGHTRWATHGAPSEVNAHPHCSDDMNVVAVHNGIIENYRQLRAELVRHGYAFHSDTDTEVAVKLIDRCYKVRPGVPVDALRRAMARLRGSYALAVMFNDFPGEIYVARRDSPMIVGLGAGEAYLASDVPAILGHTRSVYYMGDMEVGRLGKGSVAFYDMDGCEVHREPVTIGWSVEAAEKSGHEFFMMKEIREQPRAVADTLNAALRDGALDLTEAGLDEGYLKGISQVYIAACGSAYHVGLAAQYVIERLARVPVRVELASEFRYRNVPLDGDALAVIVSQSGETADSIAALREARGRGVRTLGLVNVVGSTIAREADSALYTLAGPEIAVATTKAYSAQLMAMYMLAVQLARAKGALDAERYGHIVGQLAALPDGISAALRCEERIRQLAARHMNARDAFFIGRGIDYAASMEGCLKLKEISYVHSEAYASGELKHGTISLIEPGTPVIGLLTQPELREKALSNLLECRSRGAYTVALTTQGAREVAEACDFAICLPKVEPLFMASLAVVPLQLLAYHVAVGRGLDVDKPRNLAKSVTVE